MSRAADAPQPGAGTLRRRWTPTLPLTRAESFARGPVTGAHVTRTDHLSRAERHTTTKPNPQVTAVTGSVRGLLRRLRVLAAHSLEVHMRPTLSTPTRPHCHGIRRDRESLLQALATVDIEGWDGPTASHLLDVVREWAVRPQVVAARLSGPAAAQAEATAWEATWETLRTQGLRSAESPWGILWATARRAVAGELVASTWGVSTRKAWRLSAEQVDDSEPLSLEAVLLSPGSRVNPVAAIAKSPVIDGLVDVLVDAGWESAVARDIVITVGRRAVRVDGQARIRGGTQVLTAELGISPLYARRLVALLLGRRNIPGLAERVARGDSDVACDPWVLSALKSARSVDPAALSDPNRESEAVAS